MVLYIFLSTTYNGLNGRAGRANGRSHYGCRSRWPRTSYLPVRYGGLAAGKTAQGVTTAGQNNSRVERQPTGGENSGDRSKRQRDVRAVVRRGGDLGAFRPMCNGCIGPGGGREGRVQMSSRPTHLASKFRPIYLAADISIKMCEAVGLDFFQRPIKSEPNHTVAVSLRRAYGCRPLFEKRT
jgi:hypothetical protein